MPGCSKGGSSRLRSIEAVGSRSAIMARGDLTRATQRGSHSQSSTLGNCAFSRSILIRFVADSSVLGWSRPKIYWYPLTALPSHSFLAMSSPRWWKKVPRLLQNLKSLAASQPSRRRSFVDWTACSMFDLLLESTPQLSRAIPRSRSMSTSPLKEASVRRSCWSKVPDRADN